MLKYQWTDGSSPIRSIRSQKPRVDAIPDVLRDDTARRAGAVVDPCMMATPTSSMNTEPTYFRNMDSDQSGREDSHFKIAERDMMSQIGQNPFFSYGTATPSSYADQVSLQDKFLKPLSTVHTDKAQACSEPTSV